MAAGQGTRFGAPKQRVPLLGRPLYMHGLRDLAAHPAVVEAVLVVPPGEEALYRTELLAAGLGAVRVAPGGATRTASVRHGISAISDADVEAIVVHDAARPAAPAALVDSLLAALDHASCAVPSLPVADTLRWRHGPGGPDRSAVVRVATPQAFRAADLVRAHARAEACGDEATDDALLVEAVGGRVAIVPAVAAVEKVTTPADLAAAASRLAGEAVAPGPLRMGMGLDHHRLAVGRVLVLCGVPVPGDEGLEGHSDADVALHAVANAILGAAGERDIGVHWPDDAPGIAGMASAGIVTHALGLARAKGLRTVQAQVVLTAARPRLGPHVPAMVEALAALLGLGRDAVAVHATSAEGLLGDAIEAHALVVLSGGGFAPVYTTGAGTAGGPSSATG